MCKKMKKIYRVDIVNGGSVKTLIFKKKKEKDKWLKDFLTIGEFSGVALKAYENYYMNIMSRIGAYKPYTFDEYVKELTKKSHLRLTANFKILLVREQLL